MTVDNFQDCALLTTIRLKRFFSASESEILLEIWEAFKPEFRRLQNVSAIERCSPPPLPLSNGQPAKPSPSQILFNKDYDEVNRTLVGVLALRWIVNNEYDTFTTGQAPTVRIHKSSFHWLHEFFNDHLKSPEDLFSLVLSMIVNDVGKDPDLATQYTERTGQIITGENHDTILLDAATVGLIPALNMLDEAHRRKVMLGIELGSELNAGQLAQAENLPINLEGLLSMRDNEDAFHLKFMEQILDIAGATGHVHPNGAKTLIEPVFQAFKTVHEVSLDIIRGNCNLREGYDKVLTRRGDMLHGKGYKRLSVSDRDQRALLRLLTMGRTASVDQAELFEDAFEALDADNRELLVEGLNIDGQPNETAVIPYYMPAMLSESLEITKHASNRVEALSALMRYLARVLRWTDQETGSLTPLQENTATMIFNPVVVENGPVPGIVIERNMILARETISSAAFMRDPRVLDRLEAPKGHVLQRRRTSQSM